MTRTTLILVSPFALIGVGHLVARAALPLGDWAWAAVIPLVWLMMVSASWLAGGSVKWRAWLGPPQWGFGVAALAILIGLAPAPLLYFHQDVIVGPLLISLWLLFALINPFVEEGYWRGAMLDAAARWPVVLRVVYSSSVFAVSHPLIYGTFSDANRTLEVVIATFVMGLAWSIAYLRMRSLWIPIVAHVITDVCNLAVFAFMDRFPTTQPLW